MIDRAVADAAFALKEGEVSAPVQGRFGIALVQVPKIEPEQVRTFEEVAPALKRELATERAKADIAKLYDKIEDARTDGKTLTEVAEMLKLTPRTVEAVDRSGRDPSGAPITGLPDAQRLLTSAFSTEVGAERDPLQVEGGYIWFEVAGITPSRDRPLEEVKEQVETRWREQETTNRLMAKAITLLDKLKAGSTFTEIAAADHLQVESLTGLKRGQPTAPLSASTVDAVFRTRKGELGMAEGAQGEQIVFRVILIVDPPIDIASEDAKRAQEALNRAVSEDMFSAYIARLESEIGVTINQTALNQVISGSATDTN